MSKQKLKIRRRIASVYNMETDDTFITFSECSQLVQGEYMM